MRCPDCSSRSIETLWVQPEKPEKPYRRWWCLDCGSNGIIVVSKELGEEE